MLNLFFQNGMTPLQHAAYKGNCDGCELLLAHGADVNSNEHDHGYSALMFAALSGLYIYKHHFYRVWLMLWKLNFNLSQLISATEVHYQYNMYVKYCENLLTLLRTQINAASTA